MKAKHDSLQYNDPVILLSALFYKATTFKKLFCFVFGNKIVIYSKV